MDDVLSELAEEASAQIMRALASFHDQRDQLIREGRPRRFTALQRDLLSLPLHNVVVRVTSITEDFCGARLRVAERAYLAPTGNTVAGWSRLLTKADRTWRDREAVWSKEFGISFWLCPDYAPLQGFVEARNALAHHLGALTDQQLGRINEVQSYLAAAAIPLEARRVVLNGSHAETVASIAVSFILWVDHLAPR